MIQYQKREEKEKVNKYFFFTTLFEEARVLQPANTHQVTTDGLGLTREKSEQQSHQLVISRSSNPRPTQGPIRAEQMYSRRPGTSIRIRTENLKVVEYERFYHLNNLKKDGKSEQVVCDIYLPLIAVMLIEMRLVDLGHYDFAHVDFNMPQSCMGMAERLYFPGMNLTKSNMVSASFGMER